MNHSEGKSDIKYMEYFFLNRFTCFPYVDSNGKNSYLFRIEDLVFYLRHCRVGEDISDSGKEYLENCLIFYKHFPEIFRTKEIKKLEKEEKQSKLFDFNLFKFKKPEYKNLESKLNLINPK